ncbi:hypothetical protein [Altibacter lentus]|uniref:hypothetical protein n=1 Tax=Altibacter lentus TaxID=1223410 RepID=UPI0005527C6B|nr:hypothetical protein [Altibacter lentus]
MNKFIEWHVKDNFPNLELDDILPISKRAFSLVNRNKSRLDELQGAAELLGALSILEALDYHYNRFVEIKDTPNRIHEVIAYLNRVGQFYYFVKSDFTKSIIHNGQELTHKINELIVFRMKYTAHRSIDFPKDETIEYRNRQAITFIGSQKYYSSDFEKFILPTNKNGKTEWNEFIPEIDHEKVMNEAYNVISGIVENIA